MKFTAGIKMDSSAFEEQPATELARILRGIASRAASGETSGVCRDINGNNVGTWEVSE